MHLNFDAKDLQTFQSRTWTGVYNPDLCFVSTDENGNALPAVRNVYHQLPKSQHRPVFLQVGIQIPMLQSLPVPRWNFKKANWKKYRESVDRNIRWFKPSVENFDRFAGVIIGAAKRTIPRGYRKKYIPTWSHQCEELWKEYTRTGDVNIGTRILKTLNEERKERWKTLVEGMDFKHSSRKAWDLLRKLGDGNLNVNVANTIKPNSIATRIVASSMLPVSKKKMKKVDRQLRFLKKKLKQSPFGYPVTITEVNTAITSMKPGKASGVDGLFPEFFINLGPKARIWLAIFFTDCYNKSRTPAIWNKALVRAVLKPGKPKDKPESYRPISLLCVCYKLLERIIYNRITIKVHSHVPIEQAGFTPNRGCCDQVLALTTHIEAGFEDKIKTALVLVDLSSAFDTVWRKRVLYKLAKIIRCKKTVDLITSMISNRILQVTIGGRKSSMRRMNNGLPQGAVLSSLLFILYTSDMSETISRKFLLADDLALAAQYKYNSLSERFVVAVLNRDLKKLEEYYASERLLPNPEKTEVSTFHLSNATARRTIDVQFCGSTVKYNPVPKYLGIPIDRSLTYNQHATKLCAKLRTRCNIIQKLASTSWAASAEILRTSSLALVYSTAEYCCPVWGHSSHAKRVDTTINNCLRTITGCIKSTPVPWLSVLANIPPPNIRRDAALAREARKTFENVDLPIHFDLSNRHGTRFSSRKPFWVKVNEIDYEHYDTKERWTGEWNESNLVNSNLVHDPNERLPGFELNRKDWLQLNRIRSNHGRCNALLHKWDPGISPTCDCGYQMQTIHHIVNDCPYRRFDGGIEKLFTVEDDALRWLNELDIIL